MITFYIFSFVVTREKPVVFKSDRSFVEAVFDITMLLFNKLISNIYTSTCDNWDQNSLKT